VLAVQPPCGWRSVTKLHLKRHKGESARAKILDSKVGFVHFLGGTLLEQHSFTTKHYTQKSDKPFLVETQVSELLGWMPHSQHHNSNTPHSRAAHRLG
jgi:hypothetical protein